EGSQGPLWTYGYVGNSLLLLTVVGAATALVRRQLYALAPLVLLALSLFMALGPVTALFSAQGQFVVYAFVMAAAGVGIFVAELERGAPDALSVRVKINWSRTHTIALVGLFIGADMLRYTLFLNYLVPPSPLGSPPERATAHQWLIEHRAEIQGRLLDPDQPENGWQIPMVAGIPTFQNNGDSSVYSAILTRNLRPNSPNPLNIRPYSAEELFGDAFGLLLIANVDYVIVDGPSPLAERPGAVTTADGAVLVPTGGGLPMLASRAARVVEPLLQLAPLANEIQIARERAAAAFLPVRETAPALDSASATSGPLKLQVSEHHMEGQYVRLDYTLSDAAYVQLSYGYYPYLRVSIDGVEVEKFPTTFGLIGVVSPGGRHTIEIVPYLSPLRKMVGVVNLGALLLLAALFAASFRRKRV
ncbi:MAG: hypothetical protein ACE5FI_18825, partial [Anaerolineales bacterium]